MDKATIIDRLVDSEHISEDEAAVLRGGVPEESTQSDEAFQAEVLAYVRSHKGKGWKLTVFYIVMILLIFFVLFVFLVPTVSEAKGAAMDMMDSTTGAQ